MYLSVSWLELSLFVFSLSLSSVGPASATDVYTDEATQFSSRDNTVNYFDQLIDHNNPSLGTFKQRFWYAYDSYLPGGPVVLTTPGESNAQEYMHYLTNATMSGKIAQELHGSVVLLEHRFFGSSNPYPNLSDASLKFLTVQQAIDDLEYFAKHVHLPMPGGDQLTPDRVPWVGVGGSYAGALITWTMVNKPNLFYAGYASSAPVQATLNFWKYYNPIREAMPANCSADVQGVIAHIDQVFTSNDTAAIQTIKVMFGMENVTHLDDVASALRFNLRDWQSLTPTSTGSQFYYFCDALEVKDGRVASASGWGFDHALVAWGNFWRTYYFKHLCGTATAESCLGTYNPSSFIDTKVDNPGRSWSWLTCNELGYFQLGAPAGSQSLVSRLVGIPYELRKCQLRFPDTFPSPPHVKTAQINQDYGGWDVKLERLFVANGKNDPWRDATLSAEGLNIQSTPNMPIALSNGFHCSDLSLSSAIDPTIATVQKQALASMKTWLAARKPADHGLHDVPNSSKPVIVHLRPISKP